jgi:hypothetical protein
MFQGEADAAFQVVRLSWTRPRLDEGHEQGQRLISFACL